MDLEVGWDSRMDLEVALGKLAQVEGFVKTKIVLGKGVAILM